MAKSSSKHRSSSLWLSSAVLVVLAAGCGSSEAKLAADPPDASSACVGGEFRCTGDVLETCKVDGTGFSTVTTCKTGLCDASGRQCDNCKANAGDCVGSDSIKACS